MTCLYLQCQQICLLLLLSVPLAGPVLMFAQDNTHKDMPPRRSHLNEFEFSCSFKARMDIFVIPYCLL